MRMPTAPSSGSTRSRLLVASALEQPDPALLREEVYYLAKFAGIFGLNVQDIGAQQTGMSIEAFKAKLKAAGG